VTRSFGHILKSVACACVVTAGFSAEMARAETFEFAVWFSDRDFYADMVRHWSDEIQTRTQGRVKMNLHFSGSLVSAKETLSAVRDGAAGGGTTSISFLAGTVRELSYLEPIFWIPAKPAIATEMINDITPLARGLMEKRGLELLMALPSAGVITACGSDFIKTVPDWKSKKIRAAGRWQGVQLREVGAAPVAIDPGELYVALQNKTVDCTVFLANLALSGKIYEVAPYISYWRDGANSSFYYVNLDQWKKVSPQDQKTVLELSHKVFAEWTVKLVDMQETAAKELERAGAKVYYPSDAEIAATKKAMSGVWKQIDNLVCPSGKPFADLISKHW
jgi:TRAP-type C4-dicarboxylate transport system substrate-binding protein